MPKSRSRKPKRSDSHLDQGAIEEAESLREAIAAFREKAETDPRGLAADFIEMAWDEPDDQVAQDLALDALKFDPLCSDALVILADQLDDDEPERLDLLETALGMAVQAMGERALERFAGRFGTAPETLPYLRARLYLAEAHSLRGEFAEAMRHFTGILDLWPSETLRVRTLATLALFELNDLDELERLLRRYPDEPSASWAYNWALLSFRRGGRGVAAQAHLSAALKRNRFAAEYLIGTRTFPKSASVDQLPGSRGEGQLYALDHLDVWQDTPGALDWLRDSLKAAGEI
ncbi:MAG TPA: hypothetical protein VJL84_00445 [Kiloniellales bacterium]|nr:hypothetical protein [Kiloniellales bacterium]